MQCRYRFNLDLFLEFVTATSTNNVFICRLLIHSTFPGKIQFIFSNPPDKIQFKVGVPLSVRTVRAHQHAFSH